MRNHELAHRYTKSLIDVASETGHLEDVEKDMKGLKELCATSADFVLFLKNPRLHNKEKIQVIDVLFGGKTTNLTLLFLRLLVQKNREIYLPQIIDVFFENMDARNGVHTVKLTTAIAISDELQQKVLAKMQAETSLTNVRLKCFVDETLIGGLILEYDGKMVDASLRRGIRQLRERFEEGHIAIEPVNLQEYFQKTELVNGEPKLF